MMTRRRRNGARGSLLAEHALFDPTRRRKVGSSATSDFRSFRCVIINSRHAAPYGAG
jgi:hypothetical protein